MAGVDARLTSLKSNTSCARKFKRTPSAMSGPSAPIAEGCAAWTAVTVVLHRWILQRAKDAPMETAGLFPKAQACHASRHETQRKTRQSRSQLDDFHCDPPFFRRVLRRIATTAACCCVPHGHNSRRGTSPPYLRLFRVVQVRYAYVLELLRRGRTV